METYISILRGINVSGHKMIKMEELRKVYETLKFKNVKTYIQSGNVVFKTTKAKTEELEKKIAKGISSAFGFEVPVLVIEANELKRIAGSNSFVIKRNEDITKLHVTFLSTVPEKVKLDAMMPGNYANDEFVVSGKSIYLFCPGGYGNTKLSNNFFESKFKVTATTRNWKTVNELVKMAEEISNG